MSNPFKCPRCGSGPEALTAIVRNVGQEFIVGWYENGMPTPADEIETFYDTAVTTYLCHGCGTELNEDQIREIVQPDDDEEETDTEEDQEGDLD